MDNTSGYELLSFLDTYSGYIQIRMYPPNEEKMSFMTERSNFCFKVMALGLKNTGSIYQQRMKKFFFDLIGGIMEVFVDDMVIKYPKAEDHLTHLQVIFDKVPIRCTSVPIIASLA